MAFNFTRALGLAIVPAAMFLGLARADETTDKLMELCKANDPKPATCECQVQAIQQGSDPRILAVMLAMADGTKTMEEILKDAGMTQEEFDRLSKEAEAKVGPEIQKCQAG